MSIKLPPRSLATPAGKNGPDLTGYANLPKEYLAESIIKAHAIDAAPWPPVNDRERRRGGNCSHAACPLLVVRSQKSVPFLKNVHKSGAR